MTKKISTILIILVALLLINDFQKIKYITKEKEQQIELFLQNEQTEEKKEDSLLWGILEIPKINLKQGFYNYEDKHNSVEYGLQTINKDCIPFEKCSFIIASHSGSSNISYFKNLEKLSLDDRAFLYYNQNKKEYILKKILHVEKNGTITLQIPTETELILTTCNKEKNNIQDIYIFKEKK